MTRAPLGLAAIICCCAASANATCDSSAPMPTTAEGLRAAYTEAARCRDLFAKRMADIEQRSSPGSWHALPLSAAAPIAATPYVPPTVLPNGKTCFVGPRGGTYTITASGKKNYGGC